VIKEFKDFALRGNLLELAVAFVMGVAFAAVVSSFVDDVMMNLIAAVAGKPDFNNLRFEIGDGVIRYGSFLTAVTTFLLIAWVLFWVVKAANRVMPQKVTKRDCPHCLTSIPNAATACAACGRDVAPAT
jgi:large conductance mechanosensitive channel